MNILLYDIGSYTQKDLIYYLEKQGCRCTNFSYKPINNYHDELFEKIFEGQLHKCNYDLVMSINFSPVVAQICNKNNVKYIAWVYNSPINADHIEYYQYPTSYIFLFDRSEVQQLISLGAINIYHMPLAINPVRLNQITISEEDKLLYSSDISFVGQLYDNLLPQLMSVQSNYDIGYIDGILNTQINVYGYNFIEGMITDDLLVRMNQPLLKHSIIAEPLTRRSLAHSIATQITRTERLALLNLLGQFHNVDYYSTEQPASLSHLSYKGTACYFIDMPKIFRLSKLNLNATLKSIQSGIPLDSLEILGCQGVLFSNYQPELAEYFDDGVDVIIYESIEDALCKADYYLKHDDLRIQIAQNGYQKALMHFSYPSKITNMFQVAGII